MLALASAYRLMSLTAVTATSLEALTTVLFEDTRTTSAFVDVIATLLIPETSTVLLYASRNTRTSPVFACISSELEAESMVFLKLAASTWFERVMSKVWMSFSEMAILPEDAISKVDRSLP